MDADIAARFMARLSLSLSLSLLRSLLPLPLSPARPFRSDTLIRQAPARFSRESGR